MSIIGICCVDKNWGLGKKNDLLFHLPKDMAWFKAQTSDSIVVCGLNTLLSFPGGKPLKGRSTICICPPEHEREDCFCVHDFGTLVKLVKELSKTQNVYIIGGAQTYASFLHYYDQVLITKVEADGGAEVFFPNLDVMAEFIGKPIGEPTQDGDYTIRFWKYTRVAEDKS